MNGLWNSRLPLRRLLPTAVILLAALPAMAQQPARMQPMAPNGSTAKAGDPMMTGMDQMEKAMAAVPQTGNTDQEFVAMMIPHHQGAVEMAKAELAQGKDPMLRRMAHNIITSQASQMRVMKRWEAKHPPGR